MYDFERETLRNFLEENKIDKAAVQLPSGLRPYYGEIKQVYDEEGVEVLFLATSCYGACDIADVEAEQLDCDALIHYGHADMGLSTSLPTLYIEARMKINSLEVVREALPELRNSTWGLITTVQHIGYLEKVREFLQKEGIDSKIGDPGPRSKYSGQVLGCDWGSAVSVVGGVDGFLYIGTGEFHPSGVVLGTGKPVVSVNPVAEGFEVLEPELDEFLRKRGAVLSNAKSCDSFGVMVSTKRGQNRLDLAETLTEKLESNGYDSCILVVDEVNPESLENYRLDAFVNTACPRIPISDLEVFNEPVLTPFEVQVLLGERDWESYQLDVIGTNF